MKRVNALRSTLLLTSASSLVLAGCALKNPPFGADIMPESARAQIPGRWAGPHRSGAVVPNWILTFHDPELTALVADAVERNPDLKAAAARVEASRAAVRIAASSLYPRIAMKGLGERQGQTLGGDLGRGINPPDFGSSGTDHSVGFMASQPAPHGRLTCGGAFAREKLPPRLKATRWKPTTNLPGYLSPLRWRARTSLLSRLHNRKPTRRRHSIFTRSTQNSPMCASSRASPATLMCRRSG